MLESLKTFSTENMVVREAVRKQSQEPSGEKALQIATCAVLLEAATGDDDLSKEELEHIHAALGQLYSIDASDVEHLMEMTRREREEAIDMWQFTNLINQSLILLFKNKESRRFFRTFRGFLIDILHTRDRGSRLLLSFPRCELL